MDQKKSGLFIRDLRKKKGMSQKQFAAVLNVSESAVCKWEKGVNLPDTLNLQAMSDIFQVTVNELLDGERLQMPNLSQNQEAEVTPESEPAPESKLTQEPEPTLELESNSEEHPETDPAPEPKPVPDSIPATDLADADNPPKTRALHWKRMLALCSLCIAGLVIIAFMVWLQDDTSPGFSIAESYYGAPDEFNADAYGFKQVYWVMVEYTEELTQDSIRDFSNTLSHKFNKEGKLENVDAVIFEFYEEYSPATPSNQEFIVFLPLADLDNIIY